MLFSSEILKNIPEIIFSFPIPNIPEIKEGDDIGALIVGEMNNLGGVFQNDIYVISSKVVSKAEGRVVDLRDITPTEEALRLYQILGRKSPKIIQLILDESQSYEIKKGPVIISKHRLGFFLTSAGVDVLDNNTAILLPQDPDKSAANIREQIENLTNKTVAIVISDSEGRPDRKGAGAISIGVSGINPLRINKVPLEEGGFKKTEETISDLLSAQAALIMGQRGKNVPVVCIRGFKFEYNPEATLHSIINT
jgi:coenzyme F420-0:L-glutamate ligase/coenzyme F420-1:gamma-L-glutamate ligase